MATSRLLQTIAQQASRGINPITSPAAHDVFRVKGRSGEIYSPPCRILECNGRESIAQEQQAPGFMGAFLVIRGEHLTSITYEFPMWSVAGFAAWDTLLAMLTSAQNARPQLSLRLTDLRLRAMRGGGSFDVTPILLGHQSLVAPGSWAYKVKFTRNARLQLGGGPVGPARTAAERQIDQQEFVNAGKRQLVADALADQARKAGKL